MVNCGCKEANMNFPYTETDFADNNEEVWKYVNEMDLESIYVLVGKIESKKIKGDLIEVFKEKSRRSSIPESVYVLDLVRKKFSLENYFMEEILVKKISGS